jgi:hypothetical protein
LFQGFPVIVSGFLGWDEHDRQGAKLAKKNLLASLWLFKITSRLSCRLLFFRFVVFAHDGVFAADRYPEDRVTRT